MAAGLEARAVTPSRSGWHAVLGVSRIPNLDAAIDRRSDAVVNLIAVVPQGSRCDTISVLGGGSDFARVSAGRVAPLVENLRGSTVRTNHNRDAGGSMPWAAFP